MRADAGLHADPTRRQIGEPGLHLATRPLLPQHDGTALILANDVERVLADIDADYGGGENANSCLFLRLVLLRTLRSALFFGVGVSPTLPDSSARAVHAGESDRPGFS